MEILAIRRYLVATVAGLIKSLRPSSVLTTTCGSNSRRILPSIIWASLQTTPPSILVLKAERLLSVFIGPLDLTLIHSGCGGILTSQRGVIASPLHPEVYPHGAICRWIVRAGPGKVVRLQWLSFALEPQPPSCRYDSVSVYDNSTVPNTGGLVGTYCGQVLPPTITTTGDTLTVIFRSDSSVAAEGFSASYVTVNTSTREMGKL